ncbi:MAG: DUF4276 family protein [Desulfobacterales bacterium]|nr:DUF4276 family protein [Desulfobacterales bacterium]
MIRVHVICEGQTEEEFVRHVLSPMLLERNVFLLPSCIGKVGHKGGNVNLNRLAVDIRERLLKDQDCYCTTLFDYYGLSIAFPGKLKGNSMIDIADKQSQVSQALSNWVAELFGNSPASRFIPYVQMYEFEGLLFSKPEKLANAIGKPYLEKDFQKIRTQFLTPEWINDSPNTAPSKRIKQIFHAYDKPKHPLLAALDIGLDKIRQECPLFNNWIKRLEALTGAPA